MLQITLNAGNLQDLWSQIANSVTTGGRKKYCHTWNSIKKVHTDPCQANTVAQKQAGSDTGVKGTLDMKALA